MHCRIQADKFPEQRLINKELLLPSQIFTRSIFFRVRPEYASWKDDMILTVQLVEDRMVANLAVTLDIRASSLEEAVPGRW